MSEKVEEIIRIVEGMTVLELSELVSALEEKFGVSAAPTMVAAASGAAPAAAKEEEKTEFTPMLTSYGTTKIQVIKVVRALTGLGLRDAKSLVDNCPNPIKESVPKDEAEEIKSKIEEVGGIVEIK